jgi:hypothetical protein
MSAITQLICTHYSCCTTTSSTTSCAAARLQLAHALHRCTMLLLQRCRSHMISATACECTCSVLCEACQCLDSGRTLLVHPACTRKTDSKGLTELCIYIKSSMHNRCYEMTRREFAAQRKSSCQALQLSALWLHEHYCST